MAVDSGVSTRSVVVIGARGVLGSTVVRALEDGDWRVVRGARRPVGDRECRVVDLDRPETVASAIADVDLVINVVPHPGMTAERLVLRDGGALIDISARSAAMGRRLRAEPTDPRGVVLLNAGRTPGVSNLVAAELLSAHPDADTVEIAFGFSASGISGPAGGEFVHRHLTSRRRHHTAVVPFAPPLGPQRCLQFAESEAGWLGDLGHGLIVGTYARFAPAALNRALLVLNALRLMSVLPGTMFAGKSTVPERITREPVTEWVSVLRHGTRLAACTIEGEGAYRTTVAATAVFASALLDAVAGNSDRSGCFDPQELFTLQQLDASLRTAGINVVRQ